MGLVTYRTAILRRTALARALLLFVAAGSIIVGLLAMHTIASTTEHSDPAHTAMVVEGQNLQGMAATAAAEDCDGMCDPAHGMAAMACVLALLITILLLRPSRGTSRWSYTRPIVAVGATATSRPSPRSLPPPDLQLLSISRT